MATSNFNYTLSSDQGVDKISLATDLEFSGNNNDLFAYNAEFYLINNQTTLSVDGKTVQVPANSAKFTLRLGDATGKAWNFANAANLLHFQMKIQISGGSNANYNSTTQIVSFGNYSLVLTNQVA